MAGTTSTLHLQIPGGFRRNGLRGTLAIAGLALLLAGCGQGQPAGIVTRAAPAQAQANRAGHPAVAPGQAAPTSTDVSGLLASARSAYAEHKVVAPAGDNAVAYYVAVLEKDPGNRVAKDALREIFPYGVSDVQATIAGRDTDEAGREIDLLAKADPDNYTVVLLRSELAARQGWTRQSRRPSFANVGGSHVLVLHAAADSWVEIAAADGGEVESGLLRAGESRTFHARGQVRITLGNAQGVTVDADGKPIDVDRFRRGKVAHLVAFDGAKPVQEVRLAERAPDGTASSTL